MVRVVVAVRDEAEWKRSLRTIRAHRVYLLEPRDDLAVGDEVRLVLCNPDGSQLSFSARVLHVNPARGASLDIADPEGTVIEPEAPAAPPESSDPGAVGPPGAEPGADSFDATTADTVVDDLDVHFLREGDEAAVPHAMPGELDTAAARLQAMSPTERRRYALTADRLERSLLMRDGVKLIQLFVLKNPRLDEQEVNEFVRMSTLTGEAISLIAANPRWVHSSRVRLALLKHPSTPRHVAKRLLETLSIADLFLLTKTGDVKLEVQQLARAVLERRGYT
jgi:hypothetical protein